MERLLLREVAVFVGEDEVEFLVGSHDVMCLEFGASVVVFNNEAVG